MTIIVIVYSFLTEGKILEEKATGNLFSYWWSTNQTYLQVCLTARIEFAFQASLIHFSLGGGDSRFKIQCKIFGQQQLQTKVVRPRRQTVLICGSSRAKQYANSGPFPGQSDYGGNPNFWTCIGLQTRTPALIFRAKFLSHAMATRWCECGWSHAWEVLLQNGICLYHAGLFVQLYLEL